MPPRTKAPQHSPATGPASTSPIDAVTAVQAYLERQQNTDLLRFITCGSVDDGKSTLIGRLLWEAKQIFDDQLAALKADSEKHGTQGREIDFALLVDGLTAEREQGITIDVAYRFFATDRRRFIVIDTPGHEQYTRNMITGASTADVALILLDARAGVKTQTRRHANLVALMGIKHVVLAVNKMDLVDYGQDRFTRISEDFEHFAQPLGFESITAIPLSALKGMNITERSAATPWYAGPTLIGYLETVKVVPAVSDRLVFPVQWVNRPNPDFRGFAGTIMQGAVRRGDEIRVTRSGHTATVSAIVTMDGERASANQGHAVMLTLDKELDISRGDVLSLASMPLETTDQFEASVIWLADEDGLVGRSYELMLGTQTTPAAITTIKHRVDVDTLAHEAHRKLELNDICVCNLATSKPLVFDAFETSKALGAFILIDRVSHATVAAGLIRHSLRRAQNVHRQALAIGRADRERLNGHKGCVIWFTGLSGSGKSTLANALELELHAKGRRTYILDGDNVRQGLNRDLGFTETDRVENIRRIAEVAKLMMDAGIIVMTAFISPFRREREMARDMIGCDNFAEIYVSTPLAVCEAADVKGLYRKARLGKLPNMSGIDSPYEAPEQADLVIDASIDDVDTAVSRIEGLMGRWETLSPGEMQEFIG